MPRSVAVIVAGYVVFGLSSAVLFGATGARPARIRISATSRPGA
jgi:hypothetical protein